MNNLIIRTALMKSNVRTWELAGRILRISEPTLYRKLRKEIPEDEQHQIASLIEEYAKNGGQEDVKTSDNR